MGEQNEFVDGIPLQICEARVLIMGQGIVAGQEMGASNRTKRNPATSFLPVTNRSVSCLEGAAGYKRANTSGVEGMPKRERERGLKIKTSEVVIAVSWAGFHQPR